MSAADGNTEGVALDSWVVVDQPSAQEAASSTSVPAPEPPAGASVAEPAAELDLCFLCDCTGSMGSYIQEAQRNIESIIRRIVDEQKAGVRFALISYRDHPPQDRSYVTQIFPFTSSVAEMSSYVSTMKAAGGGDGPEAVTAALSDGLNLPWRPNATKVAVLIADAPPHGLEPQGDGFPNGDPEGRDPLEITRQMAAHGITCYTVGVEPVLGQYSFARDFMCTVAEITGGQAVALSSAALLADVIVHGSVEEISLTRLQRKVEAEVESVERTAKESREAISTEECHRRACLNLQAQGVTSAQMSTDGGMLNLTPAVWHKSARPQTLAGAKAELMAMGPPPTPQPAMAGGFGSLRAEVASAAPAACSAPGGPPPLAAFACALSSPFAAGSAPPQSRASTHNTLNFGPVAVEQVSRVMARKKASA